MLCVYISVLSFSDVLEAHLEGAFND